MYLCIVYMTTRICTTKNTIYMLHNNSGRIDQHYKYYNCIHASHQLCGQKLLLIRPRWGRIAGKEQSCLYDTMWMTRGRLREQDHGPMTVTSDREWVISSGDQALGLFSGYVRFAGGNRSQDDADGIFSDRGDFGRICCNFDYLSSKFFRKPRDCQSMFGSQTLPNIRHT